VRESPVPVRQALDEVRRATARQKAQADFGADVRWWHSYFVHGRPARASYKRERQTWSGIPVASPDDVSREFAVIWKAIHHQQLFGNPALSAGAVVAALAAELGSEPTDETWRSSSAGYAQRQ
jgi:hypothetical protein